jgi:hypothetical protein
MTSIPGTSEIEWTARELTLAVIAALELFADERYARFLRSKQPGALDDEWFKWFLNTWRVARTVNAKKRDNVRAYLNGPFRRTVLRDRQGASVERAVRMAKRKGWGAQALGHGQSSSMQSLISKVAFFFRPDLFVPYDSLALAGANRLRLTSKRGDPGKLTSPSYREYLDAFDGIYKLSERQLSHVLRESWVVAVAKRLNVNRRALSRPAFRRKVLDNLLMSKGRPPSLLR